LAGGVIPGVKIEQTGAQVFHASGNNGPVGGNRANNIRPLVQEEFLQAQMIPLWNY
jgi:hypothetical protein